MKQNMIIVILALFLLVIAGAVVYLGSRYAFFFQSDNKRLFYVFFAVIIVLMLAGIAALTNATGRTANLAYGFSAILTGFMLYLLITTLTVDILGLIIKITPALSALLAISLALVISAYGIWNAARVRVNTLDIPIENFPRSFRAAHLTDTHLGHFRGATHLENIVELINSQDVDVVFFTGDLMDGLIRLRPESTLPLQKLHVPVLFVEGNHDIYTGARSIKKQLREQGIQVLENEIRNWKGIQIVGLDHMLADENSASPHAAAGGPNMKNTLASLKLEKDKASILLHHSPDGIQHASHAGIDLYLAGHTHAGQLWPITHFAKMLFRYNKGLHTFENTRIYVSQGTGTFGPPMRLGTYSELTILNIQAK